MSALEHLSAAEEQLRRTTIAYPTWLDRVECGYKGKPYDPAKTAWGRAFAALEAAREALSAPAFSIPAYELRVRPNHANATSRKEDGSYQNHNAIWLLHTSPATPVGNWGSTPCRRLRTDVSWEWWYALEFWVDPAWDISKEGSQYALPLDLHNVPDDVGWGSGSGVSATHLSYRRGALVLQHQYNYPSHEWVVKTPFAKGIWHSVLGRLVLGRTDGTVPAAGHPNAGRGRSQVWLNGSLALDTLDANTLQRAGGVNQRMLDVLEGNYGENVQQTCVSRITASRWGKTREECLADSEIVKTGHQLADIYVGSGVNLGPSDFKTLPPRSSADFVE